MQTLTELTRTQLREAARERGLPTSGNKAALAERIRQHDEPAKESGGGQLMCVSLLDACAATAEAAKPLARAALDGDERPSDRRAKLRAVVEELLRDDHGDAPAVVRELASVLAGYEDDGRPERAEHHRKLIVRELNKAV